MSLTPEQLNRATMVRQGLDRRRAIDPVDLIGELVGVQAQDPVSVYLALWNRIENFDPTLVDDAFASGSVVRCTLMRLTLHAVRRVDHTMLSQAMQPTLRSRFGDPRYAGTGLTRTDLAEHEPDLLAFADRPRTTDELHTWFTTRLDDPAQVKGMVWAVKSAGHLTRAPGEGDWSFATAASYQASPSRADRDDLVASDQALAQVLRRYLAGYGPATVPDLAQFAMVPQARVKRALELAGDGVIRLDPAAKVPLLDLPDRDLPTPDLPPRLLGMWDNVLLSHADRSRVIPPDLRRTVTRVNGDVLPTVLLDGRVAGVWRSTAGGIEVTALRPFSAQEWDGIESEAAALRDFLGRRNPVIYRRHDHWWAKLPPGQVRTFG